MDAVLAKRFDQLGRTPRVWKCVAPSVSKAPADVQKDP